MKTLAITGLFSPLGRHLAQAAGQLGMRVLGIDLKPMTKPMTAVEFIEADIRNPLLAELFKAEKVDTIVHCTFRWRQRRNEEVFDSNVLGTMRMLGAAALAGVRKVILPSSTVVYGASPDNPAFLDEDGDFAGRPSYAYVRELREVETFVNGYRRQQSDMVITTLRFANILGGGVASPLAALLSLPTPPVLLGFDPMFQVIHHDDVVAALLHCIQHDFNGVYNLSARPALPLLKIVALAGAPPIPILHPLAYLGFRTGRLLSPRVYGLAPLPWDYLRYSWVAATERMNDELGFEPAIDAETTIQQFGEAVRQQRYRGNAAYRFTVDGLQTTVATAQGAYSSASEAGRRAQVALGGLRGAKTHD